MLRLQGSSGPLFVVFSHVDVPSGSFAQSRVMRALGADALFVNPLRNDWYGGPVAGLSNSLADMATRFEQLSQAIGRPLCFVGHSMGAYAALVVAAHIDGSSYLATSPEPVIGMPGSRSRKHGLRRWHALTRSMRNPYIEKAKGAVLWGWQDPIDAYFLASDDARSGRYGDVFWVDHHHGITEYLNQKKGYLDILTGVRENQLDQNTSDLINPLATVGDRNLMDAFYQVHVQFEKSRSANASPDPGTVSAGLELRQWQNAGAQHLLSIIMKDCGRLDDAQEMALTSVQLSPYNHEYVANCGRLAIKRDDAATLRNLLADVENENISHKAYEKFLGEADAFLSGEPLQDNGLDT